MPTKPAGIHAPTWRGSAWAIGAMAVGIAIGGTGVALAALPATSSATAPAW